MNSASLKKERVHTLKESILVVDDDLLSLNLCRMTLSEEGYYIDIASSGEEALEMTKKKEYSVIITDIRMSGISGIELLKEIKLKSPEVIIILITGYASIEDAVESIRIGAYDFITKPFSGDQLKVIIRNALERRKLAQENEELKELITIHEVSQALISTMNLNKLLALIMDSVIKVTGADSGSLMLLDDESTMLSIKVAVGLDKEIIDTTKIKVGERISGWVASERQPLLLVDNIAKDSRFGAVEDRMINSAISVPLLVKNRVLGVLNVNSLSEKRSFSSKDLKVLSIFANTAAIAIDNARLYEDMEEQVKIATSKLQEAYNNIEDEKNRLNAIIQSTKAGILAVDRDGRMVLMNETAKSMFKIGSPDVIGEKMNSIIKNEEFLEAIYMSLETGLSGEAEFSIDNGVRLHFSCVTAPVTNAEDRLAGVVAVFTDITRIKEIDRLKTEFVSTVSHEFRTPLTSIRGFTEILLARNIEASRQKMFLNIINKEAKRLARLIEDLLDISKIESEEFSLKLSPCDPRKIIYEGINIVKGGLKKGQSIELEYDGAVPELNVDYDKMVEVVSNLLTNAIKYSGENRKIIVSCKNTGAGVVMSFKDQGIGISKDDINWIFDKFYRSNDDSVMKVPGTGLGLSIVKKIVEHHDGTIEVESEKNIGSTFIVTLPKKIS